MAAKAARTAKAVRAASAVPVGIFLQAAGASGRNKERVLCRDVDCDGCDFPLCGDKNTYTSVSAVRSILNGEAAEYAAENNARLELYTNGEPEITITPLSVEPYLLYIDDVTNEGDRGYWLNLALMDYYGKDRITVSEPEE